MPVPIKFPGGKTSKLTTPEPSTLDAKPEEGYKTLADMNYRSGDETCSTCVYFDAMRSVCERADNSPVDPNGSCQDWSPAGPGDWEGGDEDGDEGNDEDVYAIGDEDQA